MGARRSREEWAALIRQVEGSGESPKDFCAKHDIRLRTFEWWRWRLRRHDAPTAKPVRQKPTPSTFRSPVRLLPVVLAGTVPATPSHVELSVENVGIRIEVGTSVAYVGELVAALRARC